MCTTHRVVKRPHEPLFPPRRTSRPYEDDLSSILHSERAGRPDNAEVTKGGHHWRRKVKADDGLGRSRRRPPGRSRRQRRRRPPSRRVRSFALARALRQNWTKRKGVTATAPPPTSPAFRWLQRVVDAGRMVVTAKRLPRGSTPTSGTLNSRVLFIFALPHTRVRTKAIRHIQRGCDAPRR